MMHQRHHAHSHYDPGSGGMLAARLYGSGSRGGGAARLYGGLLPGQHAIAQHHIDEAMHNYKIINGHNIHEPLSIHDHLNILEHHLNGAGKDSVERGGFLPIPLMIGAALPLLGEALKGVLGGFMNKAGQAGASKLFGAGVPRAIHHAGGRHWVVHGDGFKDTMRSMLEHVKRLFTSEPARKIGAHATRTAVDALRNVILSKIDDATDYGNKHIESRINPLFHGASRMGTALVADRAKDKVRQYAEKGEELASKIEQGTHVPKPEPSYLQRLTPYLQRALPARFTQPQSVTPPQDITKNLKTGALPQVAMPSDDEEEFHDAPEGYGVRGLLKHYHNRGGNIEKLLLSELTKKRRGGGGSGRGGRKRAAPARGRGSAPAAKRPAMVSHPTY